MKTPSTFTLVGKWAHGQRTSTASLLSLTKTELTCTFTQYNSQQLYAVIISLLKFGPESFFFVSSFNYIQQKTFHKHRWNSFKDHFLKISLHLCFGDWWGSSLTSGLMWTLVPGCGAVGLHTHNFHLSNSALFCRQSFGSDCNHTK